MIRRIWNWIRGCRCSKQEGYWFIAGPPGNFPNGLLIKCPVHWTETNNDTR